MTVHLKIIDTNFTSQFHWLFKLSDQDGNTYYIMNEDFYKRRNLKSPITKKELDFYDRGLWITASVDKTEVGLIVVSS